MDNKILGKRLREARLAKKLTQSEVVGTFITRNMLSQIESGLATPSLQTLYYLAGALSISPAELLEGGNSQSEISLLKSAKEALKLGEYDKVIKLLESPKEDCVFYDEFCAILAKAYGEKGSKKAEKYKALGIYAKK